jgi:hypothetical protein
MVVKPVPGDSVDVWAEIVNAALDSLEAMIFQRLKTDLIAGKGDLITGTAADTPARLAPGANGQRLTADTTAPAGLRWTTPLGPADVISPGLLDAKGDLIAATAPDTPARLPVGADGRVLTADTAAATGLAWRQNIGLTTCTSATRPAPTPGATIFETDTNLRWHGINVAGVDYWVPETGAVVLRVRQTTVQSIADSLQVPLTFQTVEHNPYTQWNAGAPTRFTPTFPGWFHATGAAGFAANATNYRAVNWAKNGAYLASGGAQVLNAATFIQAVVARPAQVYLNGTGDYLELTAVQTSGAPLNTSVANAHHASSLAVSYAGP